MKTKTLLLLVFLSSLAAPIEGSQIWETKDPLWFRTALHGNVTCIDFENFAREGGQAGAVQLTGTEFPGITLREGFWTTGLFVGIPDPDVGAFNSNNFHAGHFFQHPGNAVLSPNLYSLPHGEIIVDFAHPFLGIGADFLDVDSPATSIEIFDGPRGTGHSLGVLTLAIGDSFAGLVTDGIARSAVLRLGDASDSVGLDNLCFSSPPLQGGCLGNAFGHDDLGAEWSLDALGDAHLVEAEINTGAMRLTGTGSELYHGEDNGAFVSQDIEGDFRVETVIAAAYGESSQTYRKGGLMIRESTDPLAPRVMINYLPDFPDPDQPGPALQFDVRRTFGSAGQEAASTVVGIELPVRVAVQRRDDLFSLFYSTDDGETWIAPGGGLGGEVLVDIQARAKVGAVVASYDPQSTFSVVLDETSICRPSLNLPDPSSFPCNLNAPLDWIYLLDRSATTEDSHPSLFHSPNRKSHSAAAALLALHRLVEAHGVDPRAALVPFAGSHHPLYNRQIPEIWPHLSDDWDQVERDIGILAMEEIPQTATTPTALALERVRRMLEVEGDPSRGVVVVLATDQLPNIDDEGRGPAAYTDVEDQPLTLRKPSGEFLHPDQVAIQGNSNSIGSFDGEAIADTMRALLDLRARHGDLRVFSLVPRGGSQGTPALLEELLEFAAERTQGGVFGGVSKEDLVAQAAPLLNAVRCGFPIPTRFQGRVWNDLNADGNQDPGEPGLQGVRVQVGNSPTVTGPEGFYETDAIAGPVLVRVESSDIPAEYLPTRDPDGVATAHTAYLYVDPWELRSDLDFGYTDPHVTCRLNAFESKSLVSQWTLKALGDADQVSAEATHLGALRLTSDGTSAYRGPDHGAFLYTLAEGDFQIEANLSGFPADSGGPYRKAGLMIRSSLDENASRIIVQYVPDFGGQGPALQFRVRIGNGGPGDVSLGSNVFGVELPVRLRIERNVSEAYRVTYSTDGGATWRSPAGGSGGGVLVFLGQRVLVGVNAVSYDEDTTLTTEFERVVLRCNGL